MATELGMKINGKKTEVMKACDYPKPITVTVAGCTLSETKLLKYLEAMFNSTVSVMRAISPFVFFAILDVQVLKCCR